MDTYEVLSKDNDTVVVKDYNINGGMTITLTKEEFERWKDIKDKRGN